MIQEAEPEPTVSEPVVEGLTPRIVPSAEVGDEIRALCHTDWSTA